MTEESKLWVADFTGPAPNRITINGVTYVPAVDAAPMISEVLRVLAGLLRAPGEVDGSDYRYLRVHVSEQDDTGSEGATFDEFAARLAEMVAARVGGGGQVFVRPVGSEGPWRPVGRLSARETRVAQLTGLAAQVTVPKSALEPSELELAVQQFREDVAVQCREEMWKAARPADRGPE